MKPYRFCLIVAGGRIAVHSGLILSLCDVAPHAFDVKQSLREEQQPESALSDGCAHQLYRSNP